MLRARGPSSNPRITGYLLEQLKRDDFVPYNGNRAVMIKVTRNNTEVYRLNRNERLSVYDGDCIEGLVEK